MCACCKCSVFVVFVCISASHWLLPCYFVRALAGVTVSVYGYGVVKGHGAFAQTSAGRVTEFIVNLSLELFIHTHMAHARASTRTSKTEGTCFPREGIAWCRTRDRRCFVSLSEYDLRAWINLSRVPFLHEPSHLSLFLAREFIHPSVCLCTTIGRAPLKSAREIIAFVVNAFGFIFEAWILCLQRCTTK